MINLNSHRLIRYLLTTRFRNLWFAVAIILFSSTLKASEITWKINGLDSELQQNALMYLKNLPEFPASRYQDHQPEIREALISALKALGYYQPSIQLTYNKDKPKTLSIDINAGLPVIVRAVKITLNGDAQSDKAFKRLIKQQPLTVGEVLNDGLYESLKTSLTSLALSRGYFNAELSRHQIRVSPQRQSAEIILALDSGQRYRFGQVIFDQSITKGIRKLIAPMITMEPGSPYLAESVSQLSRDLSTTGYFNYVDVQPLKDQAMNDEVPISISVTPKTAWELETGIGYSTDEGPRITLSIDKPWLGEKGHSFASDIKYSDKVSELSGRYKIPYGNPLSEYYSLDGGYQRNTLEDTNSQLISTSINKWNKRPGNWDQDFFFRVDYEDFTQGLQTSSSLLLIPGMSLDRRKVRGNPTDPRSGNVFNFKIETSSTAWQSDVDFVKAWGRAKWLTRFRDDHRLIARVEQGAIWVDDIQNIPPSIRFFTGGDQTIRGYSYNSISPKDNSGQLIGGQYLTVGSLEYNFEISESWRLALFIDKGTVTNSYAKDKVEWKTGAGPGIRWITPLGPLKLDFAFAISEPGSPLRISFTIGPDL